MYGTVHPLVNRWRGEYRNLPPVDGSSRRERDFWLSKCSRCKSTQVKVNFDSFNFELIELILIFLKFVVRWRWCSQFLKNVVENLSFDPICSNFVRCMETNFGAERETIRRMRSIRAEQQVELCKSRVRRSPHLTRRKMAINGNQ